MSVPRLFLALLLVLSWRASAAPADDTPAQTGIATLSIVALDTVTGDLGVCIVSNIPAIGAIAPWGKADVGIAVAQGDPLSLYALRGIEQLATGATPQDALTSLRQSDSLAAFRQVALLNARGDAEVFTGASCAPAANARRERGVIALGTRLPSEAVLGTILNAFAVADGDLGSRLLDALLAGSKALGSTAPAYRSAALLVLRAGSGYGGGGDRYIDLRIDGDSLPLAKLETLYRSWSAEYGLSARLRSIDSFNAMRRFDTAREELKRVVVALNEELRRKPDDPETLRRIAWVLATKEIDRERALELAKRAAGLLPTSTSVLSTLAECHFRVGHFDEAISIASRLVEKEPANDSFWRQLRRFKESQQSQPPR